MILEYNTLWAGSFHQFSLPPILKEAIMHLIQQLEEEFHGHKKAIEDNPESEHTRILFLRRIESMRLFVEEHFPGSYKKNKTLSALHELRKEGEAALDEIPF